MTCVVYWTWIVFVHKTNQLSLVICDSEYGWIEYTYLYVFRDDKWAFKKHSSQNIFVKFHGPCGFVHVFLTMMFVSRSWVFCKAVLKTLCVIVCECLLLWIFGVTYDLKMPQASKEKCILQSLVFTKPMCFSD